MTIILTIILVLILVYMGCNIFEITINKDHELQNKS